MITSWFGNLSIRDKLLWLITLTSSVALIVAGLAIVTYDSITFQRQRLNDLTTQAEMLGAISSAALVFNDAKAAREYLSALQARPELVSAVIYDSAGKVFATYHRGGGAEFAPPRADADGHRIDGGDLLLFRRISDGNETIGTVYLRARLELWVRVLCHAGIVLTWLAERLERHFSRWRPER